MSVGSFPSVLIVEENEGHSYLVEEKFRSAFPRAEILNARTLREASLLLSRKHLDLVIINSELPDGRGLDFVDQLSAQHPYTAVAILTENPAEHLNTTLSLKRHSIPVEFLTKDRQTLDSFVARVKRLLATSQQLHHLLQQGHPSKSGPLFRDPLTQTYSRSYFLESLQREVSRANRYAQEFSLLVVDIDNFKTINHRSGHPMGDRCLKKLGGTLVHSVRAGDIVARYGPDEFVILLSQCRRSDGVRCAKRVLERIGRSTKGDSFTVSIGILHYRSAHKIRKAEQVLMLAERALVRAKREGGNRYRIAA